MMDDDNRRCATRRTSRATIEGMGMNNHQLAAQLLMANAHNLRPKPPQVMRRMNPDRLQSILTTLHWSQRVCGIETGYDESTVRRWLSKARPSPIPENVVVWMEKLEAAVLACGRPTA